MTSRLWDGSTWADEITALGALVEPVLLDLPARKLNASA